MAQNGKKLTVAYGSFSCTLEGFDDGVAALKEITAHFREIAASDPAFGAQPAAIKTTPPAGPAKPAPAKAHRAANSAPAPDASETAPTSNVAARLKRLRNASGPVAPMPIDDEFAEDLEDPATPAVSAPAQPQKPQPEALAKPAETPRGKLPNARPAKAPARKGVLVLGQDAAVPEQELDRLMAKADTQMDEPGGSGRRAAFTHMRAAAVASAANPATPPAPPADAPYRDDLKQAIDGPKERPAPLRLVAEQRVDKADPAQEAGKNQIRFVDFVKDAHVENLRDMLEAAGEYICFVEGRAAFSRPELMSIVRQASDGTPGREEGLQAFSDLLRAGRIRKLGEGRFTMPGSTRSQSDGTRATG